MPFRQKTGIDGERGKRLRQALGARGPQKMMALAAAMDISPAAVSKWMQGHAMSIDNACRLSDLLDVSLDWLLMGASASADTPSGQLSGPERELIEHLRRRPAHVTPLLIPIVREIPPQPNAP